MPKREAPISDLQHFLPPHTLEAVSSYLKKYHVHLTVARERKTILGDYRHRTNEKNHRISVNGNLNTYAFLITLLHELAHLLTFETYGNRVQAHGKEWKMAFAQLLQQFLQSQVFPPDVAAALLQSIQNPAASSCADAALLRTLKQYDKKAGTLVFVESMPEGAVFETHDRRVFKKGEKLRKRFKCMEIATRRIYLFSPVYEAKLLPPATKA